MDVHRTILVTILACTTAKAFAQDDRFYHWKSDVGTTVEAHLFAFKTYAGALDPYKHNGSLYEAVILLTRDGRRLNVPLGRLDHDSYKLATRISLERFAAAQGGKTDDKPAVERRAANAFAENSVDKRKPAIAFDLAFGHWITDDGQHLYVDKDQHFVVGEDGSASEPVRHDSCDLVVLPRGGEITQLAADDQRRLGDLLEMFEDVKLLAFGEPGKELKDHPGALFFVFRRQPTQLLNRNVRVTDVLAIINGVPERAEWVQHIDSDRRSVAGGVKQVRRIDDARSPPERH